MFNIANLPVPPIPSAATLIPSIPTAVAPISITFPGGATLESFPRPEEVTQPLRLAKSLVDQAAPLLASLAPFFKLLDLIIALVKLGQAPIDAITQLSPQPIVEAVQEVLPKAAAVAALIPQLSVPAMIVGLINTIVTFLEGLVGMLTQLSNLAAKGQQAATRATVVGSSRLQAMAATIQQNATTSTANVSAGLGPLGKIIDVVNLMGELASLPGLPDLGSFTDPAAGVTVLQDFVSTIKSIRDAIPV